MTVTVSLEQFVQYLTQSGLISAAEVSSFQDGLSAKLLWWVRYVRRI
jgi:hypothetical protein